MVTKGVKTKTTTKKKKTTPKRKSNRELYPSGGRYIRDLVPCPMCGGTGAVCGPRGNVIDCEACDGEGYILAV